MTPQSPIALGKGSTTLYWDIVWMKAKSNALLVDLLESNPRYIAHKGSQAIPTSQDDPLLIYAIEDDTGEMTCTVKYSVNLVKTTSHYDGLVIHYQLRLVEEASGKSKMLNYIHYTSWPNRLVISNEDMTRLIDLVNEVNVAGSTIFVNCQYGLGRTGTFIMSREIYNTAKQSKKSGKNWFTQKGANGADPIEQYVNTLRIFRHDTIDSSRQFLFLYQWTRDLQQKLYG
ncbi:uncharacterized protein N7459_009049 [Penicillium hispanicum]|uniref:uncharacterized protein n=1 Tax=Penicillium hispanicum TaxID=1080232 RepID=UPI002540BF9C|nr:uncharacterized protein N7459_009049 [Penicillium hispanicum]KAJ5569619.1 hypothetical protein N7459_009049 [Penicillium hispanicum]